MIPPEPLGARFFKRILRPGDHLLYRGQGLWSRLIRLKTWSPVSHIEVYLGEGRVLASRENVGVGIFDLRTDELTHVLRPLRELDLVAGRQWLHHAKVLGQRYDWWGLLRFFTIGKGKQDRQFCSELATRFDRACHFHPFHKDLDADLVDPGRFLVSPAFEHWWVRRT